MTLSSRGTFWHLNLALVSRIDMALRTTILYQKGNAHGLSDDVVVFQRLLAALSSRGTLSTPVLADLREPLSLSDIQIHLEIPVYGAIPWGHVNILLVNPEQWSYAYDAYVHAFDAIFFRDALTAELFRQDFMAKGIPSDHLYTLPWCDSWETDVRPMTGPQTPGFVCFLAGSTTKYEYVKQLLPHWTEVPLRVYTTRQDVADGLKGLASSVTIIHKDLTPAECKTLSREAEGHLIVSQAEGYGYAAAHAETMGAFAIMNRLPVWEADYEAFGGVAWLSNETTPSTSARCDLARPGPRVREELEDALSQFRMGHATSLSRKRHAEGRFYTLVEMSRSLFERLFDLARDRRVVKTHRPPLLYPKDCPPISIVTPTYHREKLMDIAFHNMLATDYPRLKIEWVIVEDGTDPALSAREKIISFQLQVPELSIKYIPIEGHISIGEKRNLGVENSKHEIILFLDDDDHYPSTSFRRRVAWLLCNDKKKIASCTTIALYDLLHGTSAVNVPPYHLPLSQRISEATMTFHKSAWRERPFPAVSLAEGEGWIEGREHEVIEHQCQQIIISFSHHGNQSRRIIPSGPPSCFFGLPVEYLTFVHGLAGVEVEAVEDSVQ
jgi:hypothetical protein